MRLGTQLNSVVGSVRAMAALAALSVTAGLAVMPVGVATATTQEVLILESTVRSGSIEAAEVTALGLTPVVVDDATWRSMSSAQFAQYRALIIGDNGSCGSFDAAVDTIDQWGPSVTGNVILNGTDPADHGQGGDVLTRRSIDFAVADGGRTGAYVSLSECYDSAAPGTAVPLLDAFRPAGFTVSGASCYDDAHIVATHPALAGLSDADLSHWSCSVHEAFETWPADFTVLAVARNLSSVYTASDGTIGTPYILARGGGLRSFPLSVAPAGQSVSLGASASLIGQLLDKQTSAPAPGVRLSFRISTGPNAGSTGSCAPANCLTDTNGNVRWQYSGTRIGTDTVQVWLDEDADGRAGSGEAQTTAAVTWTAAAARRYVAMGDSFSSGEGVPQFLSGTAVVGTNTCHRSEHAYSELLKDVPALAITSYESRACSGATTYDLFYGNAKNNEPSQLDAINRDTKLITISIGGNDVEFAETVSQCVVGLEALRSGVRTSADCKNLPALDPQTGAKTTLAARTEKLVQQLGATVLCETPRGYVVCKPSLRELYGELALMAAPDVRIRVLLYPHLFTTAPSAKGCTLLKPARQSVLTVSKANIEWLNAGADKLNAKIVEQVDKAKSADVPVEVVDPRPSFDKDPGGASPGGHGVCTNDPWIHGVVRDGKNLSPFSFHPKAMGQIVFAQRMREALVP